METPRVLVLGYGEMGHAMEVLLGSRAQLDIWEKYPAAGFQSLPLEDTVPDADIILFCLPVNPHREVIEKIRPLLGTGAICVSIAKGLDEAGQTAAQVFADVLGKDHMYALLYGPMISEEIRAGRYAFAQLGCLDDGIYTRVHDLFHGSGLFMERSTDITGISWSVILTYSPSLVSQRQRWKPALSISVAVSHSRSTRLNEPLAEKVINSTSVGTSG